MDDPGAYALLVRIAVATAVMIAPSLCFLGLVRGLERLRDDDLINELARRRGEGDDRDLAGRTDLLAVLGDGLDVEGTDSSTVRCPVCGTHNRVGVTFCRDCQGRLHSS